MIPEWLINLAPVGAAVFRNLQGWIVTAKADGVLSPYEWKQLGITTIEVAAIAYAAVFGLDLDPMSAAGIAFLISWGFSEAKKIGKSK
jgi:hypothetical protein